MDCVGDNLTDTPLDSLPDKTGDTSRDSLRDIPTDRRRDTPWDRTEPHDPRPPRLCGRLDLIQVFVAPGASSVERRLTGLRFRIAVVVDPDR